MKWMAMVFPSLLLISVCACAPIAHVTVPSNNMIIAAEGSEIWTKRNMSVVRTVGGYSIGGVTYENPNLLHYFQELSHPCARKAFEAQQNKEAADWLYGSAGIVGATILAGVGVVGGFREPEKNSSDYNAAIWGGALGPLIWLGHKWWARHEQADIIAKYNECLGGTYEGEK